MTSGVAVTVALMPVVAVAVVLVLDLGRSAWQRRKRDRVFFHVQHTAGDRPAPTTLS